MLQYRNTPDPETKLSPAMAIFGRPIKDFIPILPGRYQPHPTWQDTLRKREEALRNRHMKAAERWSEHTKRLPPLRVGDTVRIQNQMGPHPRWWERTGTVVEVRQFDQYLVRVDGSRRVTLRNRKFLRRYIPVRSQQPPIISTEQTVHRAPSPFATPFTPPMLPLPAVHTPISPSDTNTDHPAAEESSTAPSAGPLPTPVPTDDGPEQTPLSPCSPRPLSPSPVAKVPLSLRRLASFNKEGKKGLGEYTPTE